MSKETKTISEAVSKKRGRGRPKVTNPLSEACVKAYFPDVKTRRGIVEVCNRIHACNLLKDDPRFLWLVDFEKMKAGAPHASKPCILSELSRILDEDDMKAIALQICELKPKTKDAIRMIRRWRTGKECPVNVIDLGDKITKIIDEYKLTHPGLTWDQIRVTLDNVLYAVNETEQKEFH